MALRKWFTGKPKTVERGAQNLRQYCKWIGKTPEQLKDDYHKARRSVTKHDDWKRDTKNNILKYYNESKEKGYKINACRTMITGVLAFYSQNCESIKGVMRQVDPIQIPENEFVFNQEILRKMYFYGNPIEKTWLSCAVSLGYGSADFLSLESEKIKNLIAEAKDKHLDFIGFIGKTRTKTSVQPRSFLTPESIHNLSDYIAMLEKKNNGLLPKLLWEKSSNDNLNDWLKALLKKSNIETYGRDVKFHCLRKFVYDTLAKMDETIASVICAKKCDVSRLTYRTSLDAECERIFRESYKLFALNGDVQGKTKVEQAEKITQLENALRAVEGENAISKTRIDSLQRELAEQKQNVVALVNDVVENRIAEIKRLIPNVKLKEVDVLLEGNET